MKHLPLPSEIKSTGMKIDQVAKHYREEGNKYIRENQLVLGAQKYTAALFSAASEREKSLALGNRSHALFAVELYPETIEDITQALKVCFFLFPFNLSI